MALQGGLAVSERCWGHTARVAGARLAVACLAVACAVVLLTQPDQRNKATYLLSHPGARLPNNTHVCVSLRLQVVQLRGDLEVAQQSLPLLLPPHACQWAHLCPPPHPPPHPPPTPTHLQVVQLRGDLAVAQQSLSEAQDVVALLRGEVANLSGAVEAQQGAAGQRAAAAGEPGRASSAQEVARLQRELATSRGLVQQLRAELAQASERWGFSFWGVGVVVWWVLATSGGLVQQLRAELAQVSERWVGWMWFLRGVPSPPGCQPGPGGATVGATVGAGSGKDNSCDVSVGAD